MRITALGLTAVAAVIAAYSRLSANCDPPDGQVVHRDRRASDSCSAPGVELIGGAQAGRVMRQNG